MLALLFAAGCEDLKDTYDDYAGDGPVRYMARCTDVKVESGWECLRVFWKNALDPNREKILVRCVSELSAFDTIVPADAEACEIKGLPDATYTVSVAALSAAGDTSLTNNLQATGRPYFLGHESVQGFTTGILKHVFIRNNLVLFMNEWDEERMADFTLHYTDTEGTAKDFNLTEAFDAGDYLLRDVDPSKEIVLTRQGYLEGCPDLITFPERTLAKGNVTMMGDFRNQLMERYGEITPELLEREELDLDYDLASLEDILYFPNLKTLNLGKNRYFGSTKKVASLTDANKRARMYFCANVLNELNEGMDVNVYRAGNKAGDMVFYNFKQKLGVYEYEGTVNEMNGSQWPADLALLDTEGWTVDITPAGETPEEFRTEMLFDDNPVTQWVPNTGQTQRSYNLTIDMQEARTVRGLKIVQGQVTYSLQNFLLESVIVQVSADGQTWTYPCHMEENTMGAVSGEKRLLNFAEEQTVRYIRLTVKDRYSNNNTDCVLGDVIPF